MTVWEILVTLIAGIRPGRGAHREGRAAGSSAQRLRWYL